MAQGIALVASAAVAVAVATSAVAVSVAAEAVSVAVARRGVGNVIGNNHFLTSAEKSALEKRISQAEDSTRAEIMMVIARQSDGYRYIPMLWAALIALSVPGLYFLYNTITTGGWGVADAQQFDYIYPIQVLVFLGLGMLFQLPAARLLIIPKSVKRQRAARHAHEQFFIQNLHQTVENTGVLIFVSVAEHYVEILVDTGIAAKIDNREWQATIDDFVKDVQSGNIAEGFNRAITHCETVLSNHFPADPQASSKRDELPNHLIEI